MFQFPFLVTGAVSPRLFGPVDTTIEESRLVLIGRCHTGNHITEESELASKCRGY